MSSGSAATAGPSSPRSPGDRRRRRETRRSVTVVFSDLKGSTALGERLDSEALREVMTRYFEEMSAALELHGGTVEKFIGDAIMAVFGMPVAHEDDALRAVRAALEMKERLAVLNEELDAALGVTLANRTGVNTGPVIASGDAVLAPAARDRRHRQRRGAAGAGGARVRGADRRLDLPARARRGRGRGGRAARAEGQVGARARLPPASGSSAWAASCAATICPWSGASASSACSPARSLRRSPAPPAGS